MRLLPSFFQYVEAPSHYAYDLVKSDSAFKIAQGFFLGWVALPITLASTPVTILADMIAGVVEGGMQMYTNGFDQEAKTILYKKLVASPVQQITFTSTAVGVAWLIIKIGRHIHVGFLFGLWTCSYFAGQWAVSMLPNSLNHKQINIFFKRGLREAGTGNSFFADELEGTIKKRIAGLQDPSAMLQVIAHEVVVQAKNGKIPGVTSEQIESQSVEYFQSVTRIVVYEFISACHRSQSGGNTDKLRHVSGCSWDFIESLNKKEKLFSLDEIDECKQVLTAEKDSEKATSPVRDFFKDIGIVVTACLRNQEFYHLLRA
jgi:hypothetical protein